MNFLLTSLAFEEGQHIPVDYTADGDGGSPPLKWIDPPTGTRSYALLVEDPDAPEAPFTHWVVFNLPAESRELGAGAPAVEGLANGTVQGTNSLGKLGYTPPQPPRSESHRYVFHLYALDRRLDLPAACRAADLRKAIKGHVLAEARLTGHYGTGEVQEIPGDPLVKKALQDRGAIHTAPLA